MAKIRSFQLELWTLIRSSVVYNYCLQTLQVFLISVSLLLSRWYQWCIVGKDCDSRATQSISPVRGDLHFRPLIMCLIIRP